MRGIPDGRRAQPHGGWHLTGQVAGSTDPGPGVTRLTPF